MISEFQIYSLDKQSSEPPTIVCYWNLDDKANNKNDYLENESTDWILFE